MKVRELINYLETLDETMDVVVWGDHGYVEADRFDFCVNETLSRLEIS